MNHLAAAFPLPTDYLTQVATSSGTVFSDLAPLMLMIVGILLGIAVVGIVIRFITK